LGQISPPSLFATFVQVIGEICAVVFSPGPHVSPQQLADQISRDLIPEKDPASDSFEVDDSAVEVFGQLFFCYLKDNVKLVGDSCKSFS